MGCSWPFLTQSDQEKKQKKSQSEKKEMTSRDKIDKARQATEYEIILMVDPKGSNSQGSLGHVVPRKLGLSPAGIAARAPIAPSHSPVAIHTHLHHPG